MQFRYHIAALLLAFYLNTVSIGIMMMLQNKHNLHEPLPDLLWEIFPDWSHADSGLITALNFLYMFGYLLMLYMFKPPMIVWRKIITCFALLYFVRAFTVVVTLTPNPRPWTPYEFKSWWEIFQIKHVFISYGDDMFSGHTLQVTVPFVAVVATYLKHKPVSVFLLSAFHAFYLMLNIVWTHFHYTVDVLVAVMMCVFIWINLPHELVDDDPKDDLYSPVSTAERTHLLAPTQPGDGSDLDEEEGQA